MRLPFPSRGKRKTLPKAPSRDSLLLCRAACVGDEILAIGPHHSFRDDETAIRAALQRLHHTETSPGYIVKSRPGDFLHLGIIRGMLPDSLECFRVHLRSKLRESNAFVWYHVSDRLFHEEIQRQH